MKKIIKLEIWITRHNEVAKKLEQMPSTEGYATD